MIWILIIFFFKSVNNNSLKQLKEEKTPEEMLTIINAGSMKNNIFHLIMLVRYSLLKISINLTYLMKSKWLNLKMELGQI